MSGINYVFDLRIFFLWALAIHLVFYMYRLFLFETFVGGDLFKFQKSGM